MELSAVTAARNKVNEKGERDKLDSGTRPQKAGPSFITNDENYAKLIENDDVFGYTDRSKHLKSTLVRTKTTLPRQQLDVIDLSRPGNATNARKKLSRSLTSLGAQSKLSLEEIRIKYTKTVFMAEVPVKEKVALMESWSQTAGDRPKPKPPAKRSTSGSVSSVHTLSGSTKVQYRTQPWPKDTDNEAPSSRPQPPVKPRRRGKEARQRRSMSDPNLQKSFQAMKELWDKKIEADPKTQTPATIRTPKSRESSSSSERRASDKDGPGKYAKDLSRPTSVKIAMVREKRTGPPIPTKPKPAQLRVKEEHLGDVRKKAYSNTDQTSKVASLVKNRAKLFDVGVEKKMNQEPNRSSLNRGKSRSATIDESNSSSVSVRRSAIEGAARPVLDSSPRLVNNNDKTTNEEPNSELAKLLNFEGTRSDDFAGKSRQNSAHPEKQTRHDFIRRWSNQSDSDSSCSAASSLSSTSTDGSVLKRNGPKDEPAYTTSEKSNGNSSPVVKSYLHRKSSPRNLQPSSPQALKPPRKGGARSHIERCESVGSVTQTGSVSITPPVTPRGKSFTHNEHNSPVASPDQEELESSPTAALYRKLSIDAAKRISMSTDSGTGTVSPGTSRKSASSAKSVGGNRDSAFSASDTFSKRGGSFSSLSSMSKTPPAPPPSSDKPTQRARSSSSSPMPSRQPLKPNVPPPPPPIAHKRSKSTYIDKRTEDVESRRDSMGSTTTISSRMSLLSGLEDGTFDAEEEYNRILDVIATPTSTKRYRRAESPPISIQSKEEATHSNATDVPRSPVSFASTNRDSLEVPSRKSRVSENDSISDFEQSDGDDEGNQIVLNVAAENETTSDAAPAPKVPVEVKLHNIAKELHSTEETYVERLRLIDQIFHKRVLEAIAKKQISSDVKNIFSNVSAIYQFHNEFLLPQLKARLETWATKPKLGDIMTQAAPFLKMYSLYVQNFDEAVTMIRHWSEKSSNFASIIKQTQAMEECGNLTLEHHMLGPVQRIPRYKMLLEDYLKRLPEDSPDRTEAETALDLISQAATHSNESMRQSDKFNKLLNIYNNLVDINFDVVDVSRELLMEGKIIKIAARNGEKHERHLYLFNDMLLCCTPQRRLQRKTYKVTAKIDLDGMEISDVANMTIPNTFCVNGTKKSMEFAANSAEEKEKWVGAIQDAIDSFLERKTSFMKSGSQRRPAPTADDSSVPGSPLHLSDSLPQPGPLSPVRSPAHQMICFEDVDTGSEEKRVEIMCTPGSQYVVDIEDHDLGKRAPRWIKDNEVTMCMNCSKAFNRLLRRRHHCRACGRVICTECSEHKLELQYETGKTHKVCNKCYAVLTGRKQTDDVDKKGVLQIEADIVSGDSVLSEYLYFAESEKRRTWTKMWCVIPSNEPCVYVYGANQDVRATMTMPLPGFTIVEDSTVDREFSIKLVQARKVLLFAAFSQEQKNRWKYVFERAVIGEDVTREEVLSLSKPSEQLQEEIVSKLRITNGSRMSSSSAESSTISASNSSDSSRPSSFVDKTNSYPDVSGGADRERESIFEDVNSS